MNTTEKEATNTFDIDMSVPSVAKCIHAANGDQQEKSPTPGRRPSSPPELIPRRVRSVRTLESLPGGVSPQEYRREPSLLAVTSEDRQVEMTSSPTNSTVDDAERQRQEQEAESIALARMLMEQEAMESYGALSADYLRYNSGQYSQDDLEALQAALAEDEDSEQDESDLSYDLMNRIVEINGDVKKERWKMMAQAHIDKLKVFRFDPKAVQDKDENDSDVKCLVCQFPYEADESLNRLPCGHAFHCECVSQWLQGNDVCPYCRQTILPDGEEP